MRETTSLYQSTVIISTTRTIFRLLTSYHWAQQSWKIWWIRFATSWKNSVSSESYILFIIFVEVETLYKSMKHMNCGKMFKIFADLFVRSMEISLSKLTYILNDKKCFSVRIHHAHEYPRADSLRCEFYFSVGIELYELLGTLYS